MESLYPVSCGSGATFLGEDFGPQQCSSCFPPQSLSTQAFYQGPIWWPTPLVSLSGQLGPSYIFRRQPQSGQGHFRDGEADGPGSEGALGGEGWPEASVQARVPSPC